MNWKTTSYNMQTAGEYAVTKTNDGRYFAWHRSELLGTYTTGDAAKSACQSHAK